jgi:hypothetical protein
MRKMLVVVLISFGALLARAQDQSGPLAAVQRFFDAMSSKDVATIHSLFASDASTLAILPDGSLSKTPSAIFEQHLGASKEPWLERIWDPKVMQHGSMAVVWAPYDFYRSGKFSHCGIDNFQLVKAEGTWKVVTVIFTVEKEGCPASPLGPPTRR